MHGKAGLNRFLATLPRPSYLDESTALIHAETTSVLPLIAETSIPLVLTSPPYNIGMEYEKPLSTDVYVDWCAGWIQELARIVPKDGSVWLNLGYTMVSGRGTAVPISYLLWDRLEPLHLVQEVVWFFRAGVSCRKRLSPRNEKLLWLVRDPNAYTFDLDAIRLADTRYPNQKKNGKLRCNPLGRNPSDVWEIPRVTGGFGRSSTERTRHPAQMPLALAERIITACSKPGDLILDPFAGSGTTLVAAKKLGRAAVGIEQCASYIEVAEERLRQMA